MLYHGAVRTNKVRIGASTAAICPVDDPSTDLGPKAVGQNLHRLTLKQPLAGIISNWVPAKPARSAAKPTVT
jgi:hypothetical protein